MTNNNSESQPATMTVGGRTYQSLRLLRGKEKHITGHELIRRAKELGADLGEDDYEHVLRFQEDIPQNFSEFEHVFTSKVSHYDDNPEYDYFWSIGYCDYTGIWAGDSWGIEFDELDNSFRVLRRIS